jgi:DNA-binding NtrC family response regulator
MSLKTSEPRRDPYNVFIEDFCQNRKICLKDFLSRVELRLIIYSLNKTNGNQREAARMLGIKPTTLNEKLKRYRVGFHVSAIDRTKHR